MSTTTTNCVTSKGVANCVTTNCVTTIYNPVYQGAENTYVCATPSDLQSLYDSIDLETLKISDIKTS